MNSGAGFAKFERGKPWGWVVVWVLVTVSQARCYWVITVWLRRRSFRCRGRGTRLCRRIGQRMRRRGGDAVSAFASCGANASELRHTRSVNEGWVQGRMGSVSVRIIFMGVLFCTDSVPAHLLWTHLCRVCEECNVDICRVQSAGRTETRAGGTRRAASEAAHYCR
jgi:hypothetical protein